MEDTYHNAAARFEQPPTEAQIESKVIEIERFARNHGAVEVVEAVKTGRSGELRNAIDQLDDEHLQSELTYWLEELVELEEQLL